MKTEIVLLFALLTAGTAVQAAPAQSALAESYKIAIAGTLNHMGVDHVNWQHLAIELASFMDRGEWA